MQLHSCGISGGVLDDAAIGLVWAADNSHVFSSINIAATASGCGDRDATAWCTSERGIHLGRIDALGRRRCERLDILRTHDKHAAILKVVAVVQEEQRALVNVEHLAAAELRQRPLYFLDHITIAHLVSIVVNCHCTSSIAPHTDLVWAHRHSSAILVKHTEGLALNLENNTCGLGIELHEVVQLVFANHVDTRADLGSLADILGEHAHFVLRKVGQERGHTVFNLDNETSLVCVFASQHLDVVTRLEQFVHTTRRHLNLLANECRVTALNDNSLALQRINHTLNSGLLALKHLDVVTGLQRRFEAALGCRSKQIEVDITVIRRRCLACEAQHLVKRWVNIVCR